MHVEHALNDNKGSFFIQVHGKKLAEMVYSLPGGNKMIIEHTEVDEELRGKNIGYELMEAAVDQARLENYKIIPLCPFANSVFKKKPDYADVLFNA